MMNKKTKNYLQRFATSLGLSTLLITLAVYKAEAEAPKRDLKLVTERSTNSLEWYGQASIQAIHDLHRTDATYYFSPHLITVDKAGPLNEKQLQRSTFHSANAIIGVRASIPFAFFKKEPVKFQLEGMFRGQEGIDEVAMLTLRKAFADFGKFKIGLRTTSFSDPKVIPKVLNMRVPGYAGTNNTQVAWVDKIGDYLHYALSIEDAPSVTRYINLTSKKSIPVFAINIRGEGKYGHAQLAGLFRTIEYTGEGKDYTLQGYGGLFSSMINIIPERTALKAQIFHANGIGGSYVCGVSNLDSYGYEEVIDTRRTNSEDGRERLVNVETNGGIISFEHDWIPEELQSTFFYSIVRVENGSSRNCKLKEGHCFSFNVVRKFTEQISAGTEYSWGRRINADQSKGDAHRVLATVSLKF